VSELDVFFEDDQIGVVAKSHDGALSFRYLDAWRELRSATPLSMSLPLSANSHGHDATRNFLWGLLPDNEQVIQRWAREFQVSATDVFGLMRNVGGDVAGAARFIDREGVANDREFDGLIPMSEADIATRIAEIRRDITTWHPTTRPGRWSLAGAQGKFALHLDPLTHLWSEPLGRVPTTHIFKPAIPGIIDHDLNEHLCLVAGRAVGLAAARTEVTGFGDERALVIERYDRRSVDGRLIRVHQEDMCQALSIHPANKYQSDGGPSPLSIAELLRVHQPSTAQRDIEQFCLALGYNWLIVGTDAHAKNYSLLLAGSQVRLAPLYDMASGLALEDIHIRKLRLPMKIGGEYAPFKIAGRHWDRLADAVGVDRAWLRDSLRHIAEALPDAFADAAAHAEVRALGSPVVVNLVERVSRWSRSCIPSLSQTESATDPTAL
jgi:serine/threonine-protein kinase HipA